MPWCYFSNTVGFTKKSWSSLHPTPLHAVFTVVCVVNISAKGIPLKHWTRLTRTNVDQWVPVVFKSDSSRLYSTVACKVLITFERNSVAPVYPFLQMCFKQDTVLWVDYSFHTFLAIVPWMDWLATGQSTSTVPASIVFYQRPKPSTDGSCGNNN